MGPPKPPQHCDLDRLSQTTRSQKKMSGRRPRIHSGAEPTIPELKKALPAAHILPTTASATSQVRTQTLQKLPAARRNLCDRRVSWLMRLLSILPYRARARTCPTPPPRRRHAAGQRTGIGSTSPLQGDPIRMTRCATTEIGAMMQPESQASLTLG